MKLSEWAKLKGISYLTAYRWFKKGKIKNSYQVDSGTILIDEYKNDIKINSYVIYARVSSRDRKKELDYQVNKIEEFSYKNGYIIDKVYKEIASGMNDNRTQLWKMIDNNPTHIIIENKDRLTRFGFNNIEKLLLKLNISIIVINKDKEDENDLMKDMIFTITSFCCKLYGLKIGLNKVKKIKEELL
jgi:predicted site-specific integrase-resolvase